MFQNNIWRKKTACAALSMSMAITSLSLPVEANGFFGLLSEEEYDSYDQEYYDYDEEAYDYDEETEDYVPAGEAGSWAIYWYLCGSDLESDGGAATIDILEMLDVTLSDDITVIIESGGAESWQNDAFSDDDLGRYIYQGDELDLLEEVESANMGDPDTLADFLRFCHENYPADHEVVLFWDHGGGSVDGAVFDEKYDYDSLKLDEFHQAFEQVYDLSTTNPPLELVGFDTCLMATIDTAGIFSDIASYLVASEELEPAVGWYYTGWLEALSENPDMSGAELGQAICDSFVEGCEMEDCDDEITLSVTDLSKVPALIKAFDSVGQEALDYQMQNPSFFTDFTKAANNAENYGGNTDAAGYSNLVDIGDLIYQNEDLLPVYSQSVLKALDDCIVYKVNGPYRDHSSGLSCYFSYNNDQDELGRFMQYSVSNAFFNLYTYCLTGEITDELMEYIQEENYSVEDLVEVAVLEDVDATEIPVTVDEDGYATIEVSEEVLNALSGAYCLLGYYLDDEDNTEVLLGSDNDLYMDWENGIFKDNFRDVWGAIDGHLCYMDIVYEGEDYNLYLVPILLNGVEYQLHVVYDYNKDAYEILGARKGLDDNGMADRNLVKLKPGDAITTLLYAASDSNNYEWEMYEFEDITVTEHTAFEEADLGDGEYFMAFQLKDCRDQSLWSEWVNIIVEDGEIEIDL